MLEDEEVYVKLPDWWFEPIPEGHVFMNSSSRKQYVEPKGG
jgi:hypothetical protein